MSEKIAPLRKPVKCPNCGSPSDRQTYPFCSKRCADVDLNYWFSERYSIETNQPGQDEE